MNWKEKYFSSISAESVSLDISNESRILKNQNIPKSLFKLYSPAPHNVEVFQKQKVYLSTPDKFNDPYDSALYFKLENHSVFKLKESFHNHLRSNPKIQDYHLEQLKQCHTIEEVFEVADELLQISSNTPSVPKFGTQFLSEFWRKQTSEVSDHFSNTVRNHHKIACFTENIASILMWSHYGANHQGFAVEYNFRDLDEDNPLKNMMFPVFYVDELYNADRILNPISEARQNTFLGLLACLQKSKEWNYEFEWRLILNLKTLSPGPIAIHKPTALYLGARIDSSLRKKLIELASKREISAFDVKLAPHSFKLLMEPIASVT